MFTLPDFKDAISENHFNDRRHVNCLRRSFCSDVNVMFYYKLLCMKLDLLLNITFNLFFVFSLDPDMNTEKH